MIGMPLEFPPSIWLKVDALRWKTNEERKLPLYSAFFHLTYADRLVGKGARDSLKYSYS